MANTIPPWGLWMMLTASAIGTCLLFRQLRQMGYPAPWLPAQGIGTMPLAMTVVPTV